MKREETGRAGAVSHPSFFLFPFSFSRPANFSRAFFFCFFPTI